MVLTVFQARVHDAAWPASSASIIPALNANCAMECDDTFLPSPVHKSFTACPVHANETPSLIERMVGALESGRIINL